MKGKKGIILGFFILLLIAVIILIISGGNDMSTKKLSKIIKRGNLDDLNLTIYYMDPSILSYFPQNVDNLISFSYEHKIIIDGSKLEEQIDLLNEMCTVNLMPVEHKSRLDARLYYVFATKSNRKIFDVAIWGKNKSMFVNGIEIYENDIFYDVIKPFLPEDVLRLFKNTFKYEEARINSTP